MVDGEGELQKYSTSPDDKWTVTEQIYMQTIHSRLTMNHLTAVGALAPLLFIWHSHHHNLF